MKQFDITKIKYFPDRFYVRLDGFDIENLTNFLTDLNIGEHQAIFIHEYFHYLTNITTFSGVRQFHANFCDRFRLVTNLAYREGINAFPIKENNFLSCTEFVEYWKQVSSIIDQDSINEKLSIETEYSPSKTFEILSIKQLGKPMEVYTNEGIISGGREFIEIETGGLINTHSFILTFGDIDEFFSSSIDKYLFENDLSNITPNFFNHQTFYPYQFLDKLFSYYDIERPNSFEKILITYFALNSSNPPTTLIKILEKLKNGGYEEFQLNPEKYLLMHVEETTNYTDLLNEIKSFADETFQVGKIHISQALKYYYDKFYIAQKLKNKDFFFFIRPFFTSNSNQLVNKQIFLLGLSRIINLFTPPVILKDKVFWTVDKLTTFGEYTMLILATYEIFESLKTNQIATRPDYLKEKYTFPDGDINCDNFELFEALPKKGSFFQLALNELGLYKLYLDEIEIRKHKKN